MLHVTLPGTGGTMPMKNRWLCTGLMQYEGVSLLIDCGEGTQIAIKEGGGKLHSIALLLITHLHADHISGLPGLLLSMGNEGRTNPLTIIGPIGITQVVTALRVIAPELPFDIYITEWTDPEQTVSTAGFTVTGFALRHTLPCLGYTVEIPRVGKFDVEKATQKSVPLAVWSLLQKQKSAEYQGMIYQQSDVLGSPRKGLKVTYCTDTRPLEIIADQAQNADLFICEGMYGEEEKIHKAVETGHMTFREAAMLASAANPKTLWLTHFSPSLSAPSVYLTHAKNIFENTVCGFDGIHTNLSFE